MSKFTDEQIANEHRRRRHESAAGKESRTATCVHCGAKIEAYLATSTDMPLCDFCASRD